MLRSGLRFAAGAAVAVLLWIYVTPGYNRLLALVAEPLLRADRRLRNSEIVTSGRRVTARGGFEQPDLPAVVIPADQLTFNFVLLAGLLATNRAPFRDRSIRVIAAVLAVLFVTHVVAMVIAIEATYATKTGDWGNRNYSPLQQDVWSALEFGYRLAGMFAIAFACWWVTRPKIE